MDGLTQERAKQQQWLVYHWSLRGWEFQPPRTRGISPALACVLDNDSVEYNLNEHEECAETGRDESERVVATTGRSQQHNHECTMVRVWHGFDLPGPCSISINYEERLFSTCIILSLLLSLSSLSSLNESVRSSIACTYTADRTLESLIRVGQEGPNFCSIFDSRVSRIVHFYEYSATLITLA